MTLIAISGVDGAGKSTQIELLAEYLTDRGSSTAVRWFRPGYSPQAERVKRLFRLPSAAESSTPAKGPDTAAKRNAAMRLPAIRLGWVLFAGLDALIEMGVVARMLSIRRVLIYDRWEFDAVLDLRINFPEFPHLVSFVHKLLRLFRSRADAQILLMVPADTALERLANKYEPFPDSEVVARQRRAGYEGYADQRPEFVVDADRPTSEVHMEILRKIHA